MFRTENSARYRSGAQVNVWRGPTSASLQSSSIQPFIYPNLAHLYVSPHPPDESHPSHQPPSLAVFSRLQPQQVVCVRSRRGMLRQYATVASKPLSRLRARGKSPVSLDHVCDCCRSKEPANISLPSFSSSSDSAHWRCGGTLFAVLPISPTARRGKTCDSLQDPSLNSIAMSMILYVIPLYRVVFQLIAFRVTFAISSLYELSPPQQLAVSTNKTAVWENTVPGHERHSHELWSAHGINLILSYLPAAVMVSCAVLSSHWPVFRGASV